MFSFKTVAKNSEGDSITVEAVINDSIGEAFFSFDLGESHFDIQGLGPMCSFAANEGLNISKSFFDELALVADAVVTRMI